MKKVEKKLSLLTGALFLASTQNQLLAKIDYSPILHDDEHYILKPLNENLSQFLVGHGSHSSHGSHRSHRSSSPKSYPKKKQIPKYVPNDPLGQPTKPPNTKKPPVDAKKKALIAQRARIIEQAQYKLKFDYEIYSGPLDGKMGPQTIKSIKKYQKIKGLDITGKLDINTLNALGISGF
jgi:His-Xaa-Ser repeat protein HxsA